LLPFKGREELRALPEHERARYVARFMWLTVALETAFGLQVAFVEGFRTVGLLLVALSALTIPYATWLTLRARRLHRRAS
jgi:hypothetical protein